MGENLSVVVFTESSGRRVGRGVVRGVVVVVVVLRAGVKRWLLVLLKVLLGVVVTTGLLVVLLVVVVGRGVVVVVVLLVVLLVVVLLVVLGRGLVVVVTGLGRRSLETRLVASPPSPALPNEHKKWNLQGWKNKICQSFLCLSMTRKRKVLTAKSRVGERARGA